MESSCLLLLKPSCNTISGEDLRQRGSSACLLQGLCFEHVLYPWRHAFFVFITSERSRLLWPASSRGTSNSLAGGLFAGRVDFVAILPFSSYEEAFKRCRFAVV